MSMRSVRSAVCAASIMALAMPSAQAQGKKDMEVTNFKSGEVIRYTTPIIIGTLADEKAEKVVLVNETSKRKTATMTGLAHKGRFKVLADLVPGENKLVIKAGKESVPLKLTFKPQTNPHLVRAVYYTDKTGTTRFPSPVSNETYDVEGKLSTAMLLMQSFTAEAMNQNGYGRKTFNVDLQPDGTVKAFVVKGNVEPNSGLNNGAVDEAINSQARRDGPTYYLVLLGNGMGYTAVGGGGKATMGGSTIYTWPNSIDQAQAAFMDATLIDGERFHVDAVGRDAFWANSSTCIGACLHEILHVLYLPHSMDGFCVMTRGIDYFNRMFTLVDPPSKTSATPYEFNDGEVARLAKVSANNLVAHRFMQMDEIKYTDKTTPEIIPDLEKREIVVKDEMGIVFVGLEVLYANPGADFCLPIDPKKPWPKEVVIHEKDWERFGDGQFQVRVINSEDRGNTDRDPLRGQYGQKLKK
jgi:hypothetical protein